MSNPNEKSACGRRPARRDILRAGAMLVPNGIAVPQSARTADSAGQQPARPRATRDIIIENPDLRLIIGADGTARSLIEKASGQECLAAGTRTPAFSMAQYAPLAGQLILVYPADAKTFAARSVRRDGDHLLVSFEGAPHEVLLKLKIAPNYIAFTVESTRTEGKGWDAGTRLKTPIEELIVLQLPVRERANFGGWLNVMWDGEVAVNLLAGDPYCRIDAQPRDGYRLLRASALDQVKTEGVTAVLIATRTARLLDRIGEAERDFGLPPGVESRRRPEYRYSYYWAGGLRPANVDRHLEYARKAGFRMMMLTYRDFAKTAGHFPWRPEYPRGQDDLREVVRKIKQAGLIPGLHIHHSKADKADAYVSGTPDNRLNMARVFTLAAALDEGATTIPVEENPHGATLDEGRRLLKVGTELISYENYATTPPYKFTGCRRGELRTRSAAYPSGIMFGLLDVDTWPIFVRFNQNTTIQKETASRIADLYRLGFEFLYFDGSEDVHPPFWFTTSWAQWVVQQELGRAPLLSEGAQRAHFNWHILTRANAYDAQQPEATKAALRAYQEVQVPETAKDFTSINFGWMGYRAPDRETIGTQPDMIEYVESRAAGWDCAISIQARLEALDAHARTPDNLEVMRRWEEVRIQNLLSPSQKRSLRNFDQEHTLLINERGDLELAACEQIAEAAGRNRLLRAFVFERAGKTVVVYWHTSGTATLELPMPGPGLRLWQALGTRELALKRTGTGVSLPAAGRLYLECTASKAEAVRAFQNARMPSA